MRNTLALALLFSTFTVLAKDTRKEVTVNLSFKPQEGVSTTSADLPPAMLDRTVDVRVEDGRRTDDGTTIGEGTNDDDQLFPIRASADPIAFLDDTLTKIGTQWGLKTEGTPERILTVSVTRFFVTESNKAVGSMYTADVKLAFTLADAKGKALAQGTGSGEAHRYGRARSGENCNEVLSDALKEAFSNVVSDASLQSAWTSGKATATASSSSSKSEAKETPEERLKKLDALYKKGLITKEEYEKKRAEILAEL